MTPMALQRTLGWPSESSGICLQPHSHGAHLENSGCLCPSSLPSANNFLFLLCLGCGDLTTVVCQKFNLLPNNEWKDRSHLFPLILYVMML